MDTGDEDQRFFIVQRQDADCISRVGSVSILMWYSTRLMENPTLEAEKVAVIVAEAIAATLILGPEAGAETWAAFLIMNMGTFLEAGLFASYMDFKDDWTQKVIFFIFMPTFCAELLNFILFFKGFLTKPAVIKATSCDPEGDIAKFQNDAEEILGAIDAMFDLKFSNDKNFVCENTGQYIGNPCLGETATQQKTFDW